MKSLIFIVAVAAFICGCSSDNPLEPSIEQLKKPGIGSIYRYNTHELNELGDTINTHSDKYIVVSNDSINHNKYDSWIIKDSGSDLPNAGYAADVRWWQNGNTLYHSFSFDEDFQRAVYAPWIALPSEMGRVYSDSLTTILDSVTYYDETGQIKAYNPFKKVCIVVTCEYVGTEVLDVASVSAVTWKYRIVMQKHVQRLNQSERLVDAWSSVIWFAPTIGNEIRREEVSMITSRNKRIRSLEGYILK